MKLHKITKYILSKYPNLVIYIKSFSPTAFTFNKQNYPINEYGHSGYEAIIYTQPGEISIDSMKIIPFPSQNYTHFTDNIIYTCNTITNPSKLRLKTPILIGHRGMGTDSFHTNILYRENTIASFKHVKGNKVQWIEFDVNITEDNIPVIYHNFKRDGKLIQNMESSEFFSHSPCDKNTWNTNMAESAIRDLRFLANANLYNYKIADLNYCSLEEVYMKCDDLSFNIEIKYPDQDEKIRYQIEFYKNIDFYLKPIMDVIGRFGKKDIFISSFNIDVCVFVRYVYYQYNVFCLCDKNVTEGIEKVIYYNLMGIIIDACLFRDAYVDILHNHGKYLMVYGDLTNNREWVKYFINAGGDGIITDKISDVIDFFNK